MAPLLCFERVAAISNRYHVRLAAFLQDSYGGRGRALTIFGNGGFVAIRKMTIPLIAGT